MLPKLVPLLPQHAVRTVPATYQNLPTRGAHNLQCDIYQNVTDKASCSLYCIGYLYRLSVTYLFFASVYVTLYITNQEWADIMVFPDPSLWCEVLVPLSFNLISFFLAAVYISSYLLLETKNQCYHEDFFQVDEVNVLLIRCGFSLMCVWIKA